MKKTHFVYGIITPFIAFFLSISLLVESQTNPSDASVMIVLRESLKLPKNFGWSNSDPCTWKLVSCSNDKRVTQIQIGSQNLQGTLPTDLRKLTALRRLELQSNQISGPLPSLTGLSSLQVVLLDNNNFSSIPSDFFSGLSSLQAVELDNNPFGAWEIPDSLTNATMLQNFSANSANVFGLIPDFFGFSFPSLSNLHLAFNNLEGELPATFAGSSMESMWLNGNKLNGSIEIIQNMTFLKQVWLHSNAFTGPLPNFSRLISLYNLNIRDNQFTGPVPSSLISLPGLQIVNLTNNLLQGPTPKFPDSVAVEMAVGTNRFCLPNPGDCDSRVNTILLIAKSLNYPHGLANVWKGNDPCSLWFGITCNGGNITIISIQKMGLVGTISPYFSLFKSLRKLILANNNLTGSIPEELTILPALIGLDVSYNQLSGKVPNFRSNVIVNTNGNPDIENNPSPNTQSGGPPGSSSDKGSGSLLGVVLGSVFGGVCAIITLLGVLGFWLCKSKKRSGRVQSPNVVVIHPHHSGCADLDMMKISQASSGPSDIQVGEVGNMVIPIQVLRNITNNFSRENILGQGGFGTVYKGQLYDGMKIAVKRMDPGLMSGKGLSEFTSEIAILNKVRHRHLVALLGYCLDGNERLLIYEYMSQGTLSRHLFNWNEEGLRPLEWTRRLTIVLDVARGVEYLHGLAHQSFIHRDLKPSNILLGDDMRAKVSDFGLVRLAPEGKNSVETRIAGTFGYLAPEYAVTGRVTMKVDVFSFGVILMELITGRKALDESQPDESMHLVTWFRRMHINEDTFRKAIDPTIDLTEETLASIRTVGDLAGHCCTWNSFQRPDMSHVVNVLSSLVELWKPSEPESEDMYGVDLDMTLPQALQQWQALEDNRHYDTASMDNNQTSVPTYLDGR